MNVSGWRLNWGSVEDWAACQACKNDIEQGLDRMMERIPARLRRQTGDPVGHPVILDSLRVLWAQFLVNRQGEPTREGP